MKHFARFSAGRNEMTLNDFIMLSGYFSIEPISLQKNKSTFLDVSPIHYIGVR